MTGLRLKVIWLSALGTLIGATVMGLTIRGLLLADYRRLESRLAVEDAARVHIAVSQRAQDLTHTVLDWAVWDETFAAVLGKNPGFFERDITDPALKNLDLDLMAFSDRAGAIVFAKSAGEGEKPQPAEIARLVAGVSLEPPGVTKTEQGATHGILLIAGRPALFASARVFPSDGGGESAGHLLIARAFGEKQVRQLGAATGLDIALEPPAAGGGAPAGGEKARLRPVSDSRLAVETSFFTFDGKPAFVARFEKGREILEQGTGASRLYAGFIALSGAMLLMLLTLMFDRLVMARLFRITSEVADIASTGDVTRRVTAQGDDEIGRLSSATNQMLVSLERGAAALTESRQAVAARVAELEEAARNIGELHDLLPICASCKKIRSDGDYWHQIDHYLAQHASMKFSHGLCPTCAEAFRRQCAAERE